MFDRFRGVAIGVSNAVGGGLMSLAPLVLGVAIARFDWRIAWVLAGVAVWVVVVPIARWGLRNNPAEIGQRLDGTPVTKDTPRRRRRCPARRPARRRGRVVAS